MTEDQQRALWRQMYKEGWRLEKSYYFGWGISRLLSGGQRVACSMDDFATRSEALAEACRIYRLTRKLARRIQRTNEHRKTGR